MIAEHTQLNKADQSPFETEKIGKLITRFAIPCIVSMLVNSLYNIVDQIFIGQGVGYLGNAATNVAFPLVTITLSFALLIGDGAAAFFSLKLGEQNKEEAGAAVGNAITMGAIFGTLFAAAGLMFLSPLLKLFGATDTVMAYAVEYTGIIAAGLPFFVMTIVINGIIRADGSPQFAMLSMILGAVLNVILDAVFIFTFGWGVKGAAVATIIGQIASFCVSMYYLRRFKNIDFHKGLLRLRFHIAKKVLSIGVSSFITQIAVTIVIIVVNRSLTYYGALSAYGSDIPLSALGIVMKVNQIIFSILIGISVGTQPIIGFNYGAQNYKRVKKTYQIAAVLSTVVSILGFIAFQFFTQPIVNIFGQEDALYNEFAIRCFKIFLLACFLNGFQITSAIFFQAIGKPIKAAALSLSRQIAYFIPLMLILPSWFGIDGILYVGPAADTLAFLTAVVFIVIEMPKLKEDSGLPVHEEHKLKMRISEIEAE